MAESLASECTPLKKEYDSCFNSWFEGYLEPAVSASSSPQKYSEYSQRKAEEFQQKCGRLWEGYRECVHKSLKEKGLDKMLEQSRDENPLSEPPSMASQPRSSPSIILSLASPLNRKMPSSFTIAGSACQLPTAVTMAHNVCSTYLNRDQDEQLPWPPRGSSPNSLSSLYTLYTHFTDTPWTPKMLMELERFDHPFSDSTSVLLSSKADSTTSVNYIPSKFSSALLNPNKFRRRKNTGHGGRREKRLEGLENEVERPTESRGDLRWNKFKWIMFFANLIFSAYSLATLVITILVWCDVFAFADIIRVGNKSELVLSTLAASIAVLTSVVGWAGILLNNRSFLAIYTLLLWITFAFLVVPGYYTYKRHTFNLEGKLNLQWSRNLHDAGRLRIQNKLGCCGFFSPFVEATISQTCYSRSVLPGCKADYLDFERQVLKRWYIICFCIVPVHIWVIVVSLLCSNHVTFRFGKGMTPRAYRLRSNYIATIVEDYAHQLTEQYGPEVAVRFMENTRSLVNDTHPYGGT
ncbi:hypothetical protein D9757_006151 [Collybiopsis confluens]|uniref:Tetraspanin Tsp2 family n=1 Tax=Collybiopsis confluens TaxID=2823264 RepID=A0A8H5HHB5_9AGAR|nr:hypothetical protein D9757_006151 [Collybiopsis confluens]